MSTFFCSVDMLDLCSCLLRVVVLPTSLIFVAVSEVDDLNDESLNKKVASTSHAQDRGLELVF